MKNELAIGIIGAGSFAAFAADAFLEVDGVRVVAVCDENIEQAKKLATILNAIFYTDYGEFLKDAAINLVYIATPPFLHFQMSLKALNAGKHVICEKPAALTTAEVEVVQGLAKKLKLLYVVNLMQRYNPLYDVVKKIVTKKLMGNFLHGFFENYASDENLNEQHWFWNEAKSGGIFIEHGVHFFDMFSGWLGKGKIVSAFKLRRKTVTPIIFDRVQATVLYKGGPVNFYHGFDQPKTLDRQEMRLQFEKGDVTLFEWIPVKIKLRGLFKTADLKTLMEIMGPCTIFEQTVAQERSVRGRFADIIYDHDVTIESGSSNLKTSRYQEMLTAMLIDQWSWIRNSEHTRIIDDSNAIESVRMGEDATMIAQQF